MITRTIELNTIEKVKFFVNTVCLYDMDIDLSSGRYVVDAKSIVGIFSFNLCSPLLLTIHAEEADELIEKLKPLFCD